MPKTLDAGSRTESLVDSLLVLVAESGLSAPSSREIAQRTRLSMGTLAHHYGTRQRLIEVLCWRVVVRLKADTGARVAHDGLAGLLPDPDDDGSGVLHRAWVALEELARSSQHVATSLRELDAHDAYLLDTLAPAASQAQREAALAALHGLRLRIGRDGATPSPTHAAGLLATCLGSGTVSGTVSSTVSGQGAADPALDPATPSAAALS